MKPHVTCLMATSVDGRILPRWWRSIGGSDGLFEKVRDEIGCDAWIVGHTTGQEFVKGKPYTKGAAAPLQRENFIARKDAEAASCSMQRARSASRCIAAK
jgi:hypothetical protein